MRTTTVLLIGILILACKDDAPENESESPPCAENSTRCLENTIERCTLGKWEAYHTCLASEECAMQQGMATCRQISGGDTNVNINTNTNTNSHIDTGTHSDGDANTVIDRDTNSGTDTNVGISTYPDAGGDTKTDGDTGTITTTDGDTVAVSDDDTDTVSDGDTNTVAGGDSDTDGDTVAVTGDDTDTGTAGDTDSVADTDKCGDDQVTGSEVCDDGNNEIGDGCSPGCVPEPICAVTNGCVSVCGDGIPSPSDGETCDDGNVVGGDGCSAVCQVESGYSCSSDATPQTLSLPVVLRDFRTDHDDFEFPGEEDGDIAYGLDDATPGLVASTLSSDKRPEFIGITATNDSELADNGLIHSKETFDTWYREPADPDATVPYVLILHHDGLGTYYNQHEDNGDQWERLGETYNGTPLYFPMDGKGITPESEYNVARIPPIYFGLAEGSDMDDADDCELDEGCNPCWPPECVTGDSWDDGDCVDGEAGETLEDYDCYSNSPEHNFLFTSQMAHWFVYDETKTYTVGFTGDDDLWIFINDHLLIDLGGIHTPVEDSRTIDASNAASFGLEQGRVYELLIFHAERQKYGSTFKLSLEGFGVSPSQCVSK